LARVYRTYLANMPNEVKIGRRDPLQSLNLGSNSQRNQVILIGIRTEVSRHYKVIIALGFWDVPTWMSQALGDLN
jgi:hypothetical protein